MDEKWSDGTFGLLCVATFFVPLVGIVAGVSGLQSASRKGQAGGLLAFGLFMGLVWLEVLAN